MNIKFFLAVFILFFSFSFADNLSDIQKKDDLCNKINIFSACSIITSDNIDLKYKMYEVLKKSETEINFYPEIIQKTNKDNFKIIEKGIKYKLFDDIFFYRFSNFIRDYNKFHLVDKSELKFLIELYYNAKFSNSAFEKFIYLVQNYNSNSFPSHIAGYETQCLPDNLDLVDKNNFKEYLEIAINYYATAERKNEDGSITTYSVCNPQANRKEWYYYLLTQKTNTPYESELKDTMLNNFVEIEDKLYYDVEEIKLEDVNKDTKIKLYEKREYSKVITFRKLREICLKNNIPDNERKNIWEKIYDNAAYSYYHEFSDKLELMNLEENIKSGTYKNTNTSKNKNIEKEYKLLEYLYSKYNLSDYYVQRIISTYPEPCYTIKPKYFGSKFNKIKSVLKNSKLSEKEKVEKIEDKCKYVPANPVQIYNSIVGPIVETLWIFVDPIGSLLQNHSNGHHLLEWH